MQGIDPEYFEKLRVGFETLDFSNRALETSLPEEELVTKRRCVLALLLCGADVGCHEANEAAAVDFDLADGICTGGAAIADSAFSCSFPLISSAKAFSEQRIGEGRLPLSPIQTLVVDAQGDEVSASGSANHSDCLLHGSELVCHGIVRNEASVAVRIQQGTRRLAATALLPPLRPAESGVDPSKIFIFVESPTTRRGSREPTPTVARGESLSVMVGAPPAGRYKLCRIPLRGMAREHDQTRCADFSPRQDLPGFEPEEPELEVQQATLRFEQPGFFEVQVCPASAERCAESSPAMHVHVFDPKLVELVEGHNDAERNRINLVFGCSFYRSFDSCKQAAFESLTLNEPLRIRVPPFSETGATDEVRQTTLSFGLFAVEPLASRKTAFNFWIIQSPLVIERMKRRRGGPAGRYRYVHALRRMREQGSRFDGLAPNRVVFIHASGSPDINITASFPETTLPGAVGIRGLPPGEVNESEILLGATTVFLPPTRTALEPRQWFRSLPSVLAHELGHAIFWLGDEYNEDAAGRPFVEDAPPSDNQIRALEHYPHVATPGTARMWWDDLQGAVDPFFATWLAHFDGTDATPLKPISEDDVRVGYIPFVRNPDGAPVVVKPTRHSLMNDHTVPIFGAVNRRQVERILDLYESDPRSSND